MERNAYEAHSWTELAIRAHDVHGSGDLVDRERVQRVRYADGVREGGDGHVRVVSFLFALRLAECHSIVTIYHAV